PHAVVRGDRGRRDDVARRRRAAPRRRRLRQAGLDGGGQAGAREADHPRARPPRLRGAPVSAPTGASLKLPVLSDGFARTVSYLRVSLTDRCNYRCVYCMPEEGVDLVPKADVLSFEEVERLVRVMMRFGVRRVRLTGGEPTVRKDVVALVERLGALGLDDLAMTTNGERLVELAAPLRRAGLLRLNVSVDTLDADKFR